MGSHFSQVLETHELEIDQTLDGKRLLLSSLRAGAEQQRVFCDSVFLGFLAANLRVFPLLPCPTLFLCFPLPHRHDAWALLGRQKAAR